MNKLQLVAQHEIRSEESLEVPLTGLDVVGPNAENFGLLVYRQSIDVQRLVISLREAVRYFPTFSGSFSYDNDEPIISVGKSTLVLSVFSVRESFMEYVRLSNQFLRYLMDTLNEVLPEEKAAVSSIILLKSSIDESCMLLWKSKHHHADGPSIWRFLRSVTQIYNELPVFDRECIERIPHVSRATEGVEPSNSKYLGGLGKNGETYFGNENDEQYSCLICVDDEMAGYIDQKGSSRRSVLNTLAVKTHATCVTLDQLKLFKVMDVRVKNLLPSFYSGNGLLFDSCDIDGDLARSAPLDVLGGYLKSRFVWSATAAKQAIAWLEVHKKALAKENGAGVLSSNALGHVIRDAFSGRTLIVNDLTHYPVNYMDFGGQPPIWYDSILSAPAISLNFLPVAIDGKAYVRVNGTEAYVGKFLQSFYENLEINYC